MITDGKILYLHMPKTGGMFARTFLSSNIKGMKSVAGWHVPAREIDKKYKKTVKLGTVRNPLSWYTSFFFDNLQKSPILIKRHKERGTRPKPTSLMRIFDPKDTQDFSVFINNMLKEDFLDENVKFKFIKEYIPYMKFMKKFDVGLCTIMYLNIYFKDFYSIMDGGVDLFSRHDELLSVDKMIKTEELNSSLSLFLKEHKYPSKICNKLKEEKKINVIRKKPWRAYYTSEEVEKILYKDRLIFDSFYTKEADQLC